MSTHTARTGTDSWVNSDAPNTNYGDGIYLRVQAGTPEKDTFIHFKNPAPRGATILSANLHMFGSANWGASVLVTAQRVTSFWAESTVDFNVKPSSTGTGAATLTQTNPADGTEWSFDVATIVQAWCDGSANYGFALLTTSTTERRFFSLGHGDFKPCLSVEWVDKPVAPTELSPSGGSAVTLAKPVVSFNFTDPVDSAAMQALQVQADPSSAGFGSPAFDSGTVLSSDPQLDLTTTGFSAMSVGDTMYWRVRVENSAGVWSPWSPVASFKRVARGTLTIGSPTGGVVSDVTQTVIWSLSGATQTAWRVIVADDSDPTHPLLDTGRRTGTATSFTLPKGIITDDSATYRLTVRVWDDPTRVKTPGDLVHTEAVETFVFVEDPTPNPPTSVVAAQVASGQPHVKLTIVIPSAPDFFSIWRDGKLVDTDVVPADIHTTGTTYVYTDRAASPHHSHTWKVRSKDAGVLGPARSSNALSFTLADIWLTDWTDPGSSRLVPVRIALADASFAMPEVAGVFRPVDGGAVVRVVQGQSGLEGHVSGRIQATAGLSASACVADMLYFKARPANELRMSMGAQNLRVIIGNVVLSPLAISDPDARHVEFDFWSMSGVTQ